MRTAKPNESLIKAPVPVLVFNEVNITPATASHITMPVSLRV
jgi:hypothetical protein